ncbi:MAG TPA: universal stress protein [Anaerolineales bacterium]|nr:universal stress protein [Anaerolineales bacterium]
MKLESMELLIATNGFKGSWPAIEYGAWFAQSMRMKITLLGVTEKLNPASIDDHHPLEDIFESAISLFKDRDVEYKLEVQNGEAENVIPEKAKHGDIITVISPLGRPQVKRFVTGRSIRPLMEKIESPIIYVPQAQVPVKKMLVCIGGLGYAVSVESLAFKTAAVGNTDVTIMHVVPPTDLDYPSSREVQAHVDDLIATDTLPGRNLRKALELAKGVGLDAKAIVREGNVVEQILTEVKVGDYDMICMGSSYSAHSLRQLYTPNITAEIAELVHCPVMTARYKPS